MFTSSPTWRKEEAMGTKEYATIDKRKNAYHLADYHHIIEKPESKAGGNAPSKMEARSFLTFFLLFDVGPRTMKKLTKYKLRRSANKRIS